MTTVMPSIGEYDLTLQTINISRHRDNRRILYYQLSSLILSMVLLMVAIMDYGLLFGFQRPDITTHDGLPTILVCYH